MHSRVPICDTDRLGSPEYISPEQAAGTHLTQGSDIYSLGIVLYELLTGRTPFRGELEELSPTEIMRAHIESKPRNPSSFNPEVSADMSAVVMRALEKNPDHALCLGHGICERCKEGPRLGGLKPGYGEGDKSGACAIIHDCCTGGARFAAGSRLHQYYDSHPARLHSLFLLRGALNAAILW